MFLSPNFRSVSRQREAAQMCETRRQARNKTCPTCFTRQGSCQMRRKQKGTISYQEQAQIGSQLSGLSTVGDTSISGMCTLVRDAEGTLCN